MYSSAGCGYFGKQFLCKRNHAGSNPANRQITDQSQTAADYSLYAFLFFRAKKKQYGHAVLLCGNMIILQ